MQSSGRRNRHYWGRLARLAVIGLVFGVIMGVIGYGLLASALYVRHLTHPGCGGTGYTPADMGIEGVQDVTYLSHDELELRAWYLPPQNTTPLHNDVVIVLLPGLGGGRDGMLREGAILARHGYGLLMTELRSCAHPEGQSTLGYKEAQDLSEAVTWVLDQPGVAHVGVLGYSLGGVTVTLGAARDERIEAVVAEGGFYDLEADIANTGGRNSLWETMFYQAILFFFHWETDVRAGDISPISVIERISPRPLLLIYGEQEVAETRPQEQLARAGEPKDLWIVPGAWHGGYLEVAAEEWEQHVIAFFDAAFR